MRDRPVERARREDGMIGGARQSQVAGMALRMASRRYDGEGALWREEEEGKEMRGCGSACIPVTLHFFFVVLSLLFTCDPSVGGALAATLSFLGLRTSLLLRTCPFAIAVTPMRCWETITCSSGRESKAYFGRSCPCPALRAQWGRTTGCRRLQLAKRRLHRTQRSRLAGGVPARFPGSRGPL